MKRPKLPAIGEEAVVYWLDSGIRGDGEPGKGEVNLVIGETHGWISAYTRSELAHGIFCRGKKCREFEGRRWSTTVRMCDQLEMVMCSHGADDPNADLGVLWVPSIVKVDIRAKRKRPPYFKTIAGGGG